MLTVSVQLAIRTEDTQDFVITRYERQKQPTCVVKGRTQTTKRL